jgi:polyketide cyclase/dehydrase/lipid transport protein
MAAISASIEIARRPEDVFAYIDELSRHGEWQEQIVSVRLDTDGPTSAGTKATEIRRIGGREQSMTYEITEHSPPRSFAFRGLDGPLRPVGKGTVEPLGDGSSSRLTLDLDFESHGLAGKLLRPLATRQARKQIPKDQQRLKERLESGAV